MFFCVIGDVIDFFTAGTIGWLIGIFIDLILLALLGISKSGRKQWKKWVTGLVGESIPIVAVLPLRSISLIWSFIFSRSAKLQTVSGLASRVAFKI